MMALDSSFLVDYLDGVEAAADFLADTEGPFAAPTLALFEVYRGAARAGGDEGLRLAAEALDWVEPLPLTEDGAREAALVEAEVLDDGERINIGDALIAGVCRSVGGSVVTRDDHFGRVAGLETIRY